MTSRIIGIILLLFTACKNKDKISDVKQTETGFELHKSIATGIAFENTIEDQKDFNILTYRNFYNGGGVGIGDINNDGLVDIYFVSNMESNRLYLNKGNWHFEDITKKARVGGTKKWSTGVAMADVNADGYLDIYVCNSGGIGDDDRHNELFINNGDGTFIERAKEFGLDDNGYGTHASFFDYDLDGDLDCFVLNNAYTDPQRIATVSRDRNNYGAPGGDRLYQNDNDRFIDVTESAGIYSGDIDFGLGISVGDVNGDRYPDMYISNDFWERDYLYINNKNGTFSEVLPDNLSYVSANSMGSDIADLNNDGYNDIFSTDMLPSSSYRMKAALMIEEYYLEDMKMKNSYFFQYIQNALQINNGDGTFKETAFYSGVAATDWSWGALIFDMNLDGKKDIFVSNGIYRDITDLDFVDFISSKDEVRKVVEKTGRSDFRDFLTFLPNNKQVNCAFINKGNLKFNDEAAFIGLEQESFSNGSAYGDLDNDGDFDLVVNNVNMPAFVYENKSSEKKHWLKIKLKGTKLNSDGIGSMVTVYADGEKQSMEIFTSRGFQSSVDAALIFGLENKSRVDSIHVIWSDLTIQKMDHTLAIDTSLTVQYMPTGKLFKESTNRKSQIFKNDLTSFRVPPIHVENKYLDYDHERLLPHAYSTEGPEIVVGDVNNDGYDDFILQGAAGYADQLFMYANGKYQPFQQVAFETDKNYESVCGVFADLDNDGDLDYICGSGGNEYEKGINNWDVRYYLNLGKGQFKRNTNFQYSGQVSCIEPNDFDKDGDVDLFIGGAGVPGNYGLISRSIWLRNEGQNKWTDITTDQNASIGMVRDAVWMDINQDKQSDLVVVGEWMPLKIFIQQQGTFVEKNLMAPEISGWFNVIEKADLDNDGDDDLVLGNWGENMKLQASNTRPLKMFVGDIDNNGKTENIIEWQFGTDKMPFPFASRKDLTSQIPSLKKNTIKYKDFAIKQVNEILPVDALNKSIKYKVNTFSSIVLMREDTMFRVVPLPLEAQLSPVFSIYISDVDQDNKIDLMLGGNYYKLKPEMGRMDGFNGGYYKGKGDGTFTFVSANDSGIKYMGEVRDIKLINNKIFIARNNDSVLCFKHAMKK